jgi:carotenoid 1,2-hydratase
VPDGGPRFDRDIPSGGYQWHYLDGTSDDGAWSVVLIALLGNPFSPRYARARAGTGASALDYCALNVALYGPGGKYWSLSERRLPAAARGARSLVLGDSVVRWDGEALVVEIDERTSLLGRPLRGRVTFVPSAPGVAPLSLDAEGRHTWWAVAPTGRLSVALQEPRVRFEGHGYHDANAGEIPLEGSFARWSWSRARVDEHRTCITYDVTPRSGVPRSFGLALDARRGVSHELGPLRTAPLPRTRWGLAREARTAGLVPRVVRNLEDTPFYSRALVETHLGGERVVAMHEELSLERFAQPWVRYLLGFRMGRA